VQFTPPGSGASIIFGRGIPSAPPGSSKGLYLVVSDIDAVRADLLARGAPVGEVFHDAGGVFHRPGSEGRLPGPAPGHRSYGSFAELDDPDGNRWLLQEVTTRLPGHGITIGAVFSSAVELAGALRRAQAAYDAQSAPTHDAAMWAATYIVAEQEGRSQSA